jgi:hypothetical protein
VHATLLDEPVEVHYVTNANRHRVLALGVRRSEDDTYGVLIADGDHDDAELALWVPRSCIHADDPEGSEGCGGSERSDGSEGPNGAGARRS